MAGYGVAGGGLKAKAKAAKKAGKSTKNSSGGQTVSKSSSQKAKK